MSRYIVEDLGANIALVVRDNKRDGRSICQCTSHADAANICTAMNKLEDDSLAVLKENNMLPVGYMITMGNGYVVRCPDCTPADTAWPAVYRVNIYPYNQRCICCDKLLVAGNPNWPILFDGK